MADKKSIFDFDDKFGYTSPFGNDWIEDDFKEINKQPPNANNKEVIDKRAMPGQTINIPKNAITKYSNDGKTLLSFSYSFKNSENIKIDRNFVAELVIKNGRLLRMGYISKSILDEETIYTPTIFFENEADAYTFMWENTENKYGRVNTEQIAYITEKGVWVSTNVFNTIGDSYNTIPKIIKGNKIYVYGQRVLAQIHTHPSFGNPEFWTYDALTTKHLLGAVGLSMAGKGAKENGIEKGLVEGAYWPPKSKRFIWYTKNSLPVGTNRESLMNGTVKLIPNLLNHANKINP